MKVLYLFLSPEETFIVCCYEDVQNWEAPEQDGAKVNDRWVELYVSSAQLCSVADEIC